MTKELEARLLASIPTVGHFQRLEEIGIEEATFHHYGPMYRYIGQIVTENGHLPRLLDLKATFNIPDHVKREPKEYDWLLTEFLKLTTIQRIQDVMDKDVEKYGEDPRELLPALVRDLTYLISPSDRMASLTDQSALLRLGRYESKIPETKDMVIGIPTGIRYFDSEYRLGWLPGELSAIIGRLYIGKSWMLIYFGAVAWLCGYRILFLSPEMPNEESEARFDALVCGLHNIPVDITDLYRGYHPTSEQKGLFEKIAKRGDWITMSSAEGKSFRPSELPRLVRQYSPHLVLVDGFSLMTGDTRRAQLWESIRDMSRELKQLAVGMGISVVVAHQANRGAANTARPPGLHEISFGDALAQDCDRVIVLSQPTKPPQTLTVTIQKFRKGRPLQTGTDFLFDPDHGRIKEYDERQRTTSKSGDNGAAVQKRQRDVDIVPIP